MSKIIIAITGPSGAGKSELTNALLELFGDDNVAFLATDFYYRGRDKDTPMEEYQKRNFDVPGELLLNKFAEHAKTLFEGKDIKRPFMDFEGGTFIRTDDKIEVKSKSVIILEGIFSLEHPEVQKLVKENGYSVFVTAPSSILLQRASFRDFDHRHKPYEKSLERANTVYNGYRLFIKKHKHTADLLLNTWKESDEAGGGKDIPEAELLETTIAGLLSKLPKDLFNAFISPEAGNETLRNMLLKHSRANDNSLVS